VCIQMCEVLFVRMPAYGSAALVCAHLEMKI
jgi:hypothetical protein